LQVVRWMKFWTDQLKRFWFCMNNLNGNFFYAIYQAVLDYPSGFFLDFTNAAERVSAENSSCLIHFLYTICTCSLCTWWASPGTELSIFFAFLEWICLTCAANCNVTNVFETLICGK
jgi:hypothetical protein